MTNIKGIEFPSEIIKAIKENKLVVFAGAGVSMGEPTNMPGFDDLTEKIARGCFIKNTKKLPSDQFLGVLENEEIEVKKRACDILSDKSMQPNLLHQAIVNLFSTSDIKIVTTNYDLMLEKVCEEKEIPIPTYSNPALPYGNDFSGLIHIHGQLNESKNIIITDVDFGKAYLVNGHVSKFLVDLFTSNYTTMFIGYSYNDVVMKYLTRAIPDLSGKKRYILTDNEEENWKLLGLTPILFNKGDYNQLNEGITYLGNLVNRGFLEWESRINTLLLKIPESVEKELIDEVLEIFKDENLIQRFLNKAKSIDWLKWIIAKNIPKKLFQPVGEQNSIDNLIASWICVNFLGKDVDEFISIVQENDGVINPKFQNTLAIEIALSDKISKNNFLKILAILDLDMIANYSKRSLLEKTVRYNLDIYTLKLFVSILNYSIKIDEDIFASIMRNQKQKEVKILFKSDLWTLKESWKIAKPLLKNHSYNILLTITNLLHEINSIRDIYDAKFNFAIFTNFISGPEHPDVFQYCIVILIEVLNEIEKNNEYILKEWILANLNSEISILRRLAVLKLKDISLIKDEDKIDLVKNHIGLFSFEEKQEVFLLVAQIFDKLSTEKQIEIISAIMNHEFEKLENSNHEDYKKMRTYSRYNWLVWLKKECNSTEEVDKNIELILKEYPNFKPRENPELSFGPIKTVLGSKSPITKEKLLNLEKLRTNYDYLVNYNEDNFDGPSREGLLDMISEASSDSFEFTIEFIKLMIEHNDYDLHIWQYIFYGLGKQILESQEVNTLIPLLSVEDLIMHQTKPLSHLLLNICENLPKNDGNLARLFQISKRLWDFRESVGEQFEGWVMKTINSSTGCIALSWINIIEKSIKGKEKNIRSEYKEVMERALKEEENGEAITVIVGHFSFLYYLDKKWTIEKLLPYFNFSDEETFTQVWEGFLRFSSLNIETGPLLEDKYLLAMERIGLLFEESRHSFISSYTTLMVYVVDKPIEKFIPKLYEYGDEGDISRFHWTINNTLETFSEKQKAVLWNRWLKGYWKNRLDNVPEPQTDKEIEEMIQWSLHLGENFPDAVELIIKQKKIELSKLDIPFILNESGMIETYPEAIGKLLLYLTSYETNIMNSWYKDDILKIYEKLQKENLPFKDELQENIMRIS